MHTDNCSTSSQARHPTAVLLGIGLLAFTLAPHLPKPQPLQAQLSSLNVAYADKDKRIFTVPVSKVVPFL